MAIIYTYPRKTKIDDADSFIITDSGDKNITKTLEVGVIMAPIYALEKEIKIIKEQIAALSSQVTANEEKIESLDAKVKELAELILGWEDRIQQIEACCTTNSENIAKNSGDIANLTATIEGNTTAIKSINENIVTINTNITNIDNSVTTLQDDVSDVQGDVSTLKNDVRDLSDEVEALKTQLEKCCGGGEQRILTVTAVTDIEEEAKRLITVTGENTNWLVDSPVSIDTDIEEPFTISNITVIDATTLTFSLDTEAGNTSNGDYSLGVVTNSGADASCAECWSVTGGVIKKLAITSTPDTELNEGEEYIYNITTSGGIGERIVEMVSILPSWATFTPGPDGTGRITGSPSEAPATIDFEIRVFDESGQEERQSWQLQITAVITRYKYELVARDYQCDIGVLPGNIILNREDDGKIIKVATGGEETSNAWYSYLETSFDDPTPNLTVVDEYAGGVNEAITEGLIKTQCWTFAKCPDSSEAMPEIIYISKQIQEEITPGTSLFNIGDDSACYNALNESSCEFMVRFVEGDKVADCEDPKCQDGEKCTKPSFDALDKLSPDYDKGTRGTTYEANFGVNDAQVVKVTMKSEEGPTGLISNYVITPGTENGIVTVQVPIPEFTPYSEFTVEMDAVNCKDTPDQVNTTIEYNVVLK